jgi:hypothetical protein
MPQKCLAQWRTPARELTASPDIDDDLLAGDEALRRFPRNALQPNCHDD